MKRLLVCLFGVWAVHLPVAAHVLDQYLQVTQIALARDGVRVELRLIPGVQVADRICPLIDTDGNGQITTMEEQSYAQRVMQDLALAVNDVNAPLTLTEVRFPTPQEMREGLGTIRLTLMAAATLSLAGQQHLTFRNNHLPELGVYLVNALVPTTKEINIGEQERDPLQRELRLRFHVTTADTARPQPWVVVLLVGLCLALFLSQWKHLRQFLRRGNIIRGA
jgi:hypothetical protein